MKRKLGALLMVLGCLLLAVSLSFFLRNQEEAVQAQAQAESVMSEIVVSIQHRQEQKQEAIFYGEETAPIVPAVDYADEEPREMTVSNINGYDYIGFLTIPALSLELPIMQDWSYDRLRISPCRYTGNLFDDDLVIMAHNYASHFGTLKDLHTGDEIIFTDMDGNSHSFCVASIETLAPTAIEEMVAGEYALTLFTCTYGGQSRVTVRCDRLES